MLTTAELRFLLALCTASVLLSVPSQAQTPREAWLDPYRETTSRLLGEALASDHAWQRLAELGDTFGHRLSGSQALEDAIDWAVAQM